MRHLLPFIFFLAPGFGRAQIQWKREIAPSLCLFVAGALEGQAETLKWAPDQFQKRFPGANMNYWNPELSWSNKYKNGNPSKGAAYFGSTTFLAWTTDGYHLTRSMKNVISLTGILITVDMKGQKWYVYLIKSALYSVAYASGFHITYSLIYE
jgi:hypothetical protein